MTVNQKLNNTCALLLAQAIAHCYENSSLITFNTNDEGFYYEFKSPVSVSNNDFNKLEKQIKKLADSALEINTTVITKTQALEMFAGNKYKIAMINQIEGNEVKIYTYGKYCDLYRGEVENNTKCVKFFKCLNVAGSYWNNDSQSDQLTRIYAVATESKEQMEEYMNFLQNRKERDHRRIGKDLGLFTFDQLCGPGMAIWLPAGMAIKHQIELFIHELQLKYDFDMVSTPVLANKHLYEISGHWEHYKDYIFPPMKVEDIELCLRPMTCPHHILVYENTPKTYKQLPVRLCEESNLFRYESSGGLTGLERVRDMVLEDTHIFCRPDQIKQEVFNCYQMIKEAYEGLHIQLTQVDLSLYDPNDKVKFHDNTEMWETSQNQLREMLNEAGIPFNEEIGEAAFYGPKIDFQIRTNLGRLITVSTIQLDFLLPERFDISYLDSNQKPARPVMVHLGVVGTYERLMAILLEQTKGVLPLWLAPVQVAILPVLPAHEEFANKLKRTLKLHNIRATVDNREERVGKKIRDAQISKVPFQIVLGDAEIKDPNTIIYKTYGGDEPITTSLSDFINMITTTINNKK